MYLFSLDLAGFICIVHNLPITDKHTGRIVKLYKIRLTAVKDLQNRKCRIRHLSHLTYRKRFCNRFYTRLQRRPLI